MNVIHNVCGRDGNCESENNVWTCFGAYYLSYHETCMACVCAATASV